MYVARVCRDGFIQVVCSEGSVEAETLSADTSLAYLILQFPEMVEI